MKIQSTSTRVRVKIDGLKQSDVYGSHFHNGRCADGGGGHFSTTQTNARSIVVQAPDKGPRIASADLS